MSEYEDEECLEDECEQETEAEVNSHGVPYPCISCQMECDGWDARYCCTLCMWYDDDPDCDNCDPMDI